MTTISEPVVTISKLPSTEAQSTAPRRILFVGGKVAAGSATSGQLYAEIDNTSQEDTLFGAKSMLAGMIREAKKINSITRIDAIPLDDAGGGVPAAGVVTFVGGPATADGTFYVTVGSYKNHRYTVAVTDTDTITDVGDALVAAITADADAPFTAANVAGVVTITMTNDGTEGNSTGLKVEGSAAGITVTLTAFTSGATNPTLTGVLDVVGEERYTDIVAPYGWGTAFLKDFLDPRWNVDNNILDGVASYAFTDTLANLKTAGNALNSQSLIIMGNKKLDETAHKGPALLELDYIVASQVAAIRALRLTQDASISRYVSSASAPLDAFGGPAIASKPYLNTPFFNLAIIPQGKGFTRAEIEELKATGIYTLGNNTAGNLIIAGEVVTTYKTDAGSNTDKTWKYLNYVDTASNAAEYIFNNLKADYAQSRLTEGDLIAGRTMANEAKIRASFVKYYSDLSGPEYTLTQAGADNIKFFKDNLDITLDLSAGKITATMKVPIVTQVREFIVPMKIVFTTSS